MKKKTNKEIGKANKFVKMMTGKNATIKGKKKKGKRKK
jgi:hypothetical protein